ncbi:MAG: hypothetical protein ACJAS4_000105 [Bacteriovoracaceae bacterium]|jgi:hypothetical protein
MIKKLLFISILIPFFGCEKSEDYVHFDDPPRIQNTNQLRTLLRDDLQIDILFVIDNSGSMGDIQENIVKNSALFMQEFTQNNIMDWRMGLMSTDNTEDPYLGFDTYFTKATIDPVTTFQKAVDSLGTYGSASEHVFYNIMRPMTDSRFGHFFRRDAHLAIIMVTDEEEQSESDHGAQFEAISLINSIKSLKTPNRIVRFYGAFNFKDLDSCKSGWGAAYANSPFQKVIDETAGIHMSACTNDFGTKLAAIGKDIIKIGESPKFTLSTRPRIETIEVLYDGVSLPMGKEEDGGVWYYDKYFNTINFYNLDFAPEFQDSKIRIKFEIDDGVDREREKS